MLGWFETMEALPHLETSQIIKWLHNRKKKTPEKVGSVPASQGRGLETNPSGRPRRARLPPAPPARGPSKAWVLSESDEALM